MPRKKDSELKSPLNLMINRDILKKFKIIVDAQDKTMNSIIANYIQSYVDEYNDLYEVKLKADIELKKRVKDALYKIDMRKKQTPLPLENDSSSKDIQSDTSIVSSVSSDI